MQFDASTSLELKLELIMWLASALPLNYMPSLLELFNTNNPKHTA